MSKEIILRICHKFLISEDGYDLDIQDLCKSTSSSFRNYVLTYINCSIKDYVRSNKLTKIDKRTYYHKKLKTYIYPITYSKKYNTILNNLYSMRNIKSFIKKYKEIFDYIKPNIISIHGTLIPQFLYSAYYSKNKCKVIATHHIGLINTHYRKQKGIILILKYVVHNLLPLFCDNVICVSNYGKKSFDLYKSNIKVINPVPLIPKVNLTTNSKLIKKNILKNKFKINKKDKVFCCIGRLSAQKNQLRIIKAFNNSLYKKSNYKLIIIGEIANHNYYKLIIEEINKNKNNYCLIRNIKNAEVINAIKNSDFLISTTLNEGFGRNAMEAQLLGKPIIASKNNGYKDFIKEDDNGILVDPENVKEIEKAVISIKKTKKKTKKKSHKNYIQKIIKLYRS